MLCTTQCTTQTTRKGEYKLTVWPGGDWTIGKRTPPSTDRDDHPLADLRDPLGMGYQCRSPIPTPLRASDRDRLLSDLVSLSDARSELGDDPGAVAAMQAAIDLSCGLTPLGLSAEFISHKIKKSCGRPPGRPVVRRGQRGITTYGKRMVRSGAVLLERHGRGNLTLGTATLPSLTPAEMMAVAADWSNIVRRFFQTITRKLAQAGLPTDYVAVTEIQPKRWERWGQLAYHLHWVIVGRAGSRDSWAVDREFGDRAWSRAIAPAIGYDPDTRSACRLEKPRKSLRGELGKYLSKGNQVCSKVIEKDLGSYLPTSWFSMSKSLKSEIKASITCYTGDSAEWLLDRLNQCRDEKLISFTHVWAIFGVNEITGEVDRKWIGVAGRFLSDRAQMILLDCLTNLKELPVDRPILNIA